MLNGKISVIDRGRIVTVLNQGEATIVFGLEMAVQKYGSQIACTGTHEWKRMVTMTAVKHGIFAQFTDPRCKAPSTSLLTIKGLLHAFIELLRYSELY
jgi:hypothetical protein